MKSTFASLLFYLFLMGTVSAQSSQSEPDFLTGKGLLFKFEGLSNLNLNSFSGGIGFKYTIDESTWLRHILSISSSRQNPHHRGNETKGSQLGFNLNTDYIIDMAKREQLKPFWGGGFNVGYRNYYDLSESNLSKNENNRNSYSFGIGGLIGVEYYVKENISLSAEYNVNLVFAYTEQFSESTNKPAGIKSKTFFISERGLYLNTSSFGLVASFYL